MQNRPPKSIAERFAARVKKMRKSDMRAFLIRHGFMTKNGKLQQPATTPSHAD